MRSTMIVSVILVSITNCGQAADKPKPDDPNARIATYMTLLKSGVFYSDTHDVKNGEFLRVYVVGRASIPTSLGVEEGISVAQDRAEEAAKTAFVTWLNGKVTVRKTTANQLIITTEGDDGAVREQAKKVEKRTKEFEETASSIVRGFKVVGVEQKAKDKSYTVVYRWDGRLVAAIGKIDQKLNKPNEAPKSDPKNDNQKKGSGDVIPDKRIIIEESR